MTTIPPTTLAPTSAPDITIVCDPLIVRTTHRHSRGYYPVHGRDALLDITYNADPLSIAMSLEGDLYGFSAGDFGNEVAVSINGELVIGQIINCNPLQVTLEQGAYGMIVERVKCNFVSWSKPGALDFTIDRTNEAGTRPMDWKGCVYEILKLGKGVVIYGDNGVTVVTPSGVFMGMNTVRHLGVACKGAVVGTDFEHYFIDTKDKLFSLNEKEGLQLLDYSEYISLMTDPQMSMDPENGIIYICDGTYGYVYSTQTKSFGSGPVNVSGIDSQSGILYVVSPDVIEVPKFEICTDIYDFGNRSHKTVSEIEIGTDLTDGLEMAIEFRNSINDSFKRTRWVPVTRKGIAYIPCFGVEFRFRLKSNVYEYFEVDYLKINGSVHGYNYLNSL